MTANLDMLYNNGEGPLRQCLAIFDGTDGASGRAIGETCSPARNPAQSMILDATQLPPQSDTVVLQVYISLPSRKTIASSNVTITIVADPPSADLRAFAFLSGVQGLGPGMHEVES